MDILYTDKDMIVCVKPAGVLSTDEPGGLPELLRAELGTGDVRTVHRLDRVVSGLMVLARNAARPRRCPGRSGRAALTRTIWLWSTARPLSRARWWTFWHGTRRSARPM